MDASAELHDALHAAGLSAVAPYAVSMAYRIRFYMDMNAREAMHLIELRTAPQGHPAYRRICQAMHTLIAEQAGHRLIADAMTFADHSEVELERLKAERAAERKRKTRHMRLGRLADWKIGRLEHPSAICQSANLRIYQWCVSPHDPWTSTAHIRPGTPAIRTSASDRRTARRRGDRSRAESRAPENRAT